MDFNGFCHLSQAVGLTLFNFTYYRNLRFRNRFNLLTITASPP